MDKPIQDDVGPNRGFTLGVGLFCVTLALFMFFQSALFALDEVVIDGNQYLRVEEVLSLAGIDMGMNLFDINLRAAEARLKKDPRVAEAHFVRRLPRGIDLTLEERVPIAYVPLEHGFAAMDVAGRVLTVNVETRLRLPRIALAEAPASISPGDMLTGDSLNPRLQIAEALRPDLVGRVREIQLHDNKIELMLDDDQVRVQLGEPTNITEKLERLRVVLRSIGSGNSITEIDLRFPQSPVLR